MCKCFDLMLNCSILCLSILVKESTFFSCWHNCKFVLKYDQKIIIEDIFNVNFICSVTTKWSLQKQRSSIFKNIYIKNLLRDILNSKFVGAVWNYFLKNDSKYSTIFKYFIFYSKKLRQLFNWFWIFHRCHNKIISHYEACKIRVVILMVWLVYMSY